MMGKAEEALPYLQKAMAILPDPEIAAHLGEVQWFLGDRQAALQSWQRGLVQSPNHPTIKSTMQRLGADGLNPDALNPDTLNPSTINPNSDVDSATLIDLSHSEPNQ